MNCRICNASSWEEVMTVGDVRYQTTERLFQIMKCMDCGVLATRDDERYVDPSPFYPEQYGAFVLDVHPKEKQLPRSGHLRCFPYAALGRLSWLEHVDCTPGTRVLDVGCGSGKKLARLRDLFSWEAIGIEPNSQAVAIARSRGLEVHEGTLDSYMPSEPFDLVVLSHVLEHIPYPRSALHKVKNLLRPGGRLIVLVPNAASVERRKFGPMWDAWDVPRHIHHFSPTSLRRLLGDFDISLTQLSYECYTVARRSLANKSYPDVPYSERTQRVPASFLNKYMGRLLAILRTSSAIQVIGIRL